MKTYSEKLKDPRWQRKRLEIMQRDGFACRGCSSKSETLNVHHTYYAPRMMPWDYPTDSLVTLCESCHNEITYRLAKVQETIKTPEDAAFAEEFFRLAGGTKTQCAQLALQLCFAMQCVEESATPCQRRNAGEVLSHVINALLRIKQSLAK